MLIKEFSKCLTYKRLVYTINLRKFDQRWLWHGEVKGNIVVCIANYEFEIGKKLCFDIEKTTILWIMKSLFFSKLLILIFPNFGLFRTLNDKRKQNSVDAISEKRSKSFFLHISPGNSWEYGTLPWVEHVKSQNSCFICEYCSDLIWIIC